MKKIDMLNYLRCPACEHILLFYMDVLKAIPTYSPDVIFNDCSAVIPGLIKLSIPNQYIIVNTDEGDIKYSIKRVSVDKLLVTEMENNNNEDIGQDANGS